MIEGFAVIKALSEKLEKLQEENTRLEAQLEHMTEDRNKYKNLCMIDPPTGLYNQRGILLRFRQFLLQKKRENENGFVDIILFIIDLNDFKPINDSFGHLVGNEAINAVASTLLRNTRSNEAAGREGGDEFLLLVSADSEVKEPLFNRILKGIWDAEASSSLPPISLSIGELHCSVDLATIGSETQFENILKEWKRVADERMYKAKNFYKERVFLRDQRASVLCEESGEMTLFFRGRTALSLDR